VVVVPPSGLLPPLDCHSKVDIPISVLDLGKLHILEAALLRGELSEENLPRERPKHAVRDAPLALEPGALVDRAVRVETDPSSMTLPLEPPSIVEVLTWGELSPQSLSVTLLVPT
jgi:hypothetical protein